MSSLPIRTLCTLLALLLGAAPTVSSVRAQGGADTARTSSEASPARYRIGVHLGLPTGVGAAIEVNGRSVDLLAAWGLDRYFFAHTHLRLAEGPFPPRPDLAYYLGPGLAFRVRDGLLRVGPSVHAGLTYPADPLVFFLQAAPHLEIVPEIRPGATLGVGTYVRF